MARKSDFVLPTIDDPFSTQEQRYEAKLQKIRNIPISEIGDFPDHPFKVRDDKDIRKNGSFSFREVFKRLLCFGSSRRNSSALSDIRSKSMNIVKTDWKSDSFMI